MHVVVQTAPATRVALGEEFGMPPGSIVEGKQVAALKALGFGAVFDTNFSADLTIMEEGSEFLSRLTKKGHAAHKPLPQFTSCSPGWVKFCEMFYPDLLDCMSTCKSPQQMLGVLSKTYYAKKKGIPPEKIFSVSIMPCTAKKSECLRPEINAAGRFYGKTNMRDVDAVLTTRELGRLIKMKNINLTLLKDAPYDSLMGESTGAAVIFGASGGVMESAVRTTYYLVTGDNPPDLLLNLKPVRGLDGCKEAALAIPGVGEVRVAVVHGLGNARRMLDYVRSERKAGRTPSFHFIEFMACPGGCIGGGGQPRSSLPPDDEVMQARIDSIYAMDAKSYKKRLSYENREVQKLYEDFLGKPNGELAEKLLHTGYEDKSGHFIAKDDAPATCLRRYE
jgi:iron-only hydrogenase group A